MANEDSPRDVFRVRLNCVDHYQHAPSSLDPPLWGASSISSTQKHSLPQVPIIRVFGSTETGQKVCAHIHGAFPYLYIPYTESLDKQHVSTYIDTLHHSIDHALALSYRRNPYDAPRKSAFVAHISLVKGVPFFGYNVGYKYYLKIYMLNPLHMTRFADLLQQGAIMKKTLQPYEAHLQFLLQWMCDFNLYGCAYIETNKPHFRLPVPQWEELDNPTHLWHDRSLVHHQKLNEDVFPRQSHCQLEIDIRVEDILNRHDIQARPLHHSFIERLASLENLPPEEKLVHSMKGLWKDETKRRKRRMGITDPSSSPFPAEVLVSMSADPRNTEDGGWIHEEEFREMIDNLAKQEERQRAGNRISFDTFGSHNGDENDIQTVLESVQELFHPQLSHKLGIDPHSSFHQVTPEKLVTEHTNGDASQCKVIVDEATLAQFTDDIDVESDEEQAREQALTQRQKVRAAGLENGLHLEAKLEGDVDMIENAASHVENAPMADHLVQQEQGSLKRSAPTQSQGPFKRAKPSEPTTQDQPRKVKFRVRDVKADKRSSSFSKDTDERPTFANSTQAPSSSQRGPASSQRSSQSSQNNRLHLPVIKSSSDRVPSQRAKTGSLHSSDDSYPIKQSVNGTISPQQPRINSQVLANYSKAFRTPSSCKTVMYSLAAPPHAEIAATVLPSVIYQDAYYSDEKDVPERAREYGGQEFKLVSTTLPFLPDFDPSGEQTEHKPTLPEKAKSDLAEQRQRRQCSIKSWELAAPPPTYEEVLNWLKGERQPTVEDDLDALEVDGPPASTQIKRKNRPAPELSQIDGPTQKNKHGFKFSQKKASTSVQHETGYMSTMSLEVHVNSRGELAPDPERDEVSMITWSIADDQMDEKMKIGILVLNKEDDSITDQIRSMVGEEVQVDSEDTELDLLNRMVDIVREYDPDVLTGFEVHNGSWGYLIERARLQYEYDLPDEFSRMKSQSHGRFGKDADRWGFTQTSTVRVTGRHTINIWRAMRSELNLLQYTMENIVFNLLHQRIPHYPYSALTRWYTSGKPKDLAKVLDYLVSRTKLDLEILDANELIPRTSEQARLLGVDFFSVFSRGSQYKVESLMFRIAKPESFVLVSPSRKQVGAQNALECLPLVMEPQSAFYPSPLLVLDFQSLYPSVMIAYNYCYSTCLGRIVNWRGTNKMGFADFQRTPGLLELVKDKLNIAPNGMMYVKPEMRKSLLAKMLGEILETRVMVKSGMKVDKNDKTLQQLLNNRQLALKLIANVTYGYTSASFSGRMPCSEIADSIVQTGRETLEKAIALIHSVERWGAEVVYGDTDSLFIYLKGRTRADAFKIGNEIAKAVTDANPRPVKLKFEKVYHPCVLLAKKRYVGFKYESPDQVEPEFDAKGIETVRRDGTPAEQKIEEKALKLLFRTADLSQVKQYFQAQCAKIMSGRISVQDFCFAKEVKLGSYSDKGVPPPGALIATKRMLRDPRTEPQYGERVPYVVIAGGPGARLWERCVEPERLIHDEFAELDAEYYINKNLIPPLERIFNLVGANVRQWYDEMPKVLRVRMLGGVQEGDAAGKSRKTMESYMGASICMVCRGRLPPVTGPPTEVPLPLCQECREDRTQETILALWAKLQKAEDKARSMEELCRNCANLTPHDEVRCDSRDCPVFYSRVKAKTQLRVARSGIGKVVETLQDEVTQRVIDEW